MAEIQPHERIFVPLDIDRFEDDHKRLVDKLARKKVRGFKLGLTTTHSRSLRDRRISVESEIEEFMWTSFPHLHIFKDPKLKDIPDQVAGAARGIAARGAWGFTIHADNTLAAMKAALENAGKSLVIGVTVLTSHSDDDCLETYSGLPQVIVRKFAERFVSVGGKAIVCSPRELKSLRQSISGLTAITPGIRNKDDPPDDQARTATAFEAARDGADYFVIGRPITRARDPADAAERFADDIARGIDAR